MPNVTLHFMAANDLNGTPLLEVTDEDDYLKAVELRIALDELGGGSVRFARKVGFALFDSGAVQPEVFVRVLVHAWSDTQYFWGFFLDKREQKVIGEEGTEEMIFGGPGPKYYLDRAILTNEQFTGTGWNVDVDNGVFRFNSEVATAGRILNRIVQEARNNPIDAVPDLTLNFNDSSDSAGNAWTNTVVAVDDDFELPIGQSLLDDLWELEDVADLETRIDLGSVSNRRFRLEAYPSIGTDYSGGAYAADVLRFVEASSLNPNGNIGSPEGGASLWVKGQSLRKASHVLVRGKDGAYATAVRSAWSPGDYVKWASIDYPRSSNENILEAAGTRWIRRQDNGEQQFDIPIIPGTDPTEGRYFPGPDELLWVGNTCSLFTGDVSGTPLDYRNDDFRVTGIKLTSMREASDASDALKRAMSWEVVVQLNTERGGASSPSQGTTGASSSGSCNCRPRLCRHSEAAEFASLGTLGAACSNDGANLDSDYAPWAGDKEERVEIALSQDAPAGTSIIVWVRTNIDGAQGALYDHQVYDEQGNAWTMDDQSPDQGSNDIVVEIWRCNVTNALSTGDYVRFAMNLGASNSATVEIGRRCIAAHLFSGTLSAPSVGTSGNAFSASPAVASSATGGLVVAGAVVGGGTSNPDADWSASADIHDGGSTTLIGQYLIPGANESFGVAYSGGNADWSITTVAYTVTAGSGDVGDGRVELVGTSKRTKRCDDTEHYHTDSDPTTDDDWSQGWREGTLWVNETTGAAFLLVDKDTGDWVELTAGGTDVLPWVNVLDHGADPTGVSDSLAAFDAALATRTDRSAAVIVPPGTYRMTGPLVLGNSTVILGIGANMEEQVSGMDTLTYRPHSVLYFDNDTHGIVAPDDAAVTYRCHHPILQNLTIRGGGAVEGNKGIWLRDNASSSVAIQRVGLAEIRDCFIEYWDTAIDFDGTADSCKVIGGHIHDCDKGFVGGLSEDVFERVCVWDLDTGPAVSISGDRGQVIGCEIEPQIGSGVIITGDYNRIIGNDVKDITGTAIDVAGDHNVIVGNTASRSISDYYNDIGTGNEWGHNTPAVSFPAASLAITADDVRSVGRWEPVTNGVDTFVWDGDEIVVHFVETP